MATLLWPGGQSDAICGLGSGHTGYINQIHLWERPETLYKGDDALSTKPLMLIPLSQLLVGPALNSDIFISQGVTAAPPSSWDKGCPDKHHIGHLSRSASSPNIRSLKGLSNGCHVLSGI